MASKATVKFSSRVEGIEDALKKIKQLTEVGQEEVLDTAVEAGALLIENAAKENVTTGGQSGLHVINGNLRRSIDHRRVK